MLGGSRSIAGSTQSLLPQMSATFVLLLISCSYAYAYTYPSPYAWHQCFVPFTSHLQKEIEFLHQHLGW